MCIFPDKCMHFEHKANLKTQKKENEKKKGLTLQSHQPFHSQDLISFLPIGCYTFPCKLVTRIWFFIKIITSAR